jgi:hypothetical protein
MDQIRDRGEELARRGQAIYDQQIRSRLSADDDGNYLVLDVDSGDYAIDASDLTAFRQMRDRCPSGTFYIVRIGSPAAYRLGRGGPVAES